MTHQSSIENTRGTPVNTRLWPANSSITIVPGSSPHASTQAFVTQSDNNEKNKVKIMGPKIGSIQTIR